MSDELPQEHAFPAASAIGAITVVVGGLLMVMGLVAGAIVASLVSVAGHTGLVSQSLPGVVTPAQDVALLADGVRAELIPAGMPAPIHQLLTVVHASPEELVDRYGEFFLLVSTGGPGDLFVGTDSNGAVDDYLFGYPYTAGQLADGTWTLRSVPGEGQPGAPADGAPWVLSAHGNPAELDASGIDGQTLVVMNADASPGVDAAFQLEYRAPQAAPAVRGAAALALICTAGGLALVLLGMSLLFGPTDSRE